MNIATLVVAGVLMAVFAGFLWIRGQYRKYCAMKDLEDELNFKLSSFESRISAMLSSLDANYGGGISGSISKNVRDKVDFSLTTLRTLSLYDRVPLMERLYGMVYETCVRIAKNRDDVEAITSPLNSFCREIARKKLDLIKSLSEDEA